MLGEKLSPDFDLVRVALAAREKQKRDEV